MRWVSEVSAEIDRLVVATHDRAGALYPGHALAGVLTAHPGVVNALGLALMRGPVAVESLKVIHPYLPARLIDLLVENNVAEGVVQLEAGELVLTQLGYETARLANELLDEAAGFSWCDAGALSPVETVSDALIAHACTLDPPAQPSAFAVTCTMTDRPTQAGRLFRLLSALRYWRADAHRAAWAVAGLTVQEAHALNQLWDLDRGIDRVGQGDPRPGRTGVTALSEKGYAAGDTITEAGRQARASIEADTDDRTEPVYAPLDDAARTTLLAGLRQLRIN
ncbi:MAG TPA: hypothetical protein VMZ22_04450 [Acidimicrobiales bacterium]|nr:hypothetical protein [Acidimicrobiales bacterium]